jgi:hypothetical protein
MFDQPETFSYQRLLLDRCCFSAAAEYRLALSFETESRAVMRSNDSTYNMLLIAHSSLVRVLCAEPLGLSGPLTVIVEGLPV